MPEIQRLEMTGDVSDDSQMNALTDTRIPRPHTFQSTEAIEHQCAALALREIPVYSILNCNQQI